MAGGPISWRSKTQETVALSSTQAEYQALCAACQETIHLRLLSSELDSSLNASQPLIIYEDNKGAIAMSQIYATAAYEAVCLSVADCC